MRDNNILVKTEYIGMTSDLPTDYTCITWLHKKVITFCYHNYSKYNNKRSVSINLLLFNLRQ